MSSLLALTLSKLPLEELKSICYGPPSPLKNQLLEKCDWEVWRDRAEFILKIPSAYFDLPRTFFSPNTESNFSIPSRNITGLQRYIEVATYIKINNYSPVIVEEEYIEGVFENYYGIWEAIIRNDVDGVGIFFPLLDDEPREIFRERLLERIEIMPKSVNDAVIASLAFLGIEHKINISDYNPLNEFFGFRVNFNDLALRISRGDEEAFNIFLREITGSNDPSYHINKFVFFLATIYSGKIAWVQALLKRFLLIDISIIDHIPLLPFTPGKPGEIINFPLIKLPITLNYDRERIPLWIKDIIRASVYSCNVQLVDFFRSLFNIERPDNVLIFLEKGYTFHRKPVEAYSILQRIKVSAAEILTIQETDNTDLILLKLSLLINGERSPVPIYPYIKSTLFSRVGNISLLLTLIPILLQGLEKNMGLIQEILADIDKGENRILLDLYPLATEIFKDYFRAYVK